MPNKEQHADVIYLCSPNNPTGACYNKEQLKEWVDYALANEAVILFDSAYEAFITDPELPRSIFAIEGAKKCAIEFCSLSKTAGFTGTRCGYTVVPKELVFKASNGEEMSLNACGTVVSAPNSTVLPISCRRAQRLYFLRKASESVRKISTITREMLK